MSKGFVEIGFEHIADTYSSRKAAIHFLRVDNITLAKYFIVTPAQMSKRSSLATRPRLEPTSTGA